MEKLINLLELPDTVEVIFIWDIEKNKLLKKNPGRNFKGFEDVVLAILKNKVLDILENKNYPNQYILVVEIDNYIYGVPISLEMEKEEENLLLFIHFKTLYPSRKLLKRYKFKKEESNG